MTPPTIVALRPINVTPHVTQNDSLTKTGKRRRSAIDPRTTRHKGYRCPNRVERWSNASSAGASSTAQCARPNIVAGSVSADFMLNLIAYNLVRIPKLIAA